MELSFSFVTNQYTPLLITVTTKGNKPEPGEIGASMVWRNKLQYTKLLADIMIHDVHEKSHYGKKV
jgi:hypothetical protein